MSNKFMQIGPTQSGTRNVFAGATVFTLSGQADAFTANLRLAITGSAGVNPTTWIVRVQQGIWVEEWYGETTGGANVALIFSDVFFIASEAITITLENDAPADTAVVVEATLFGQIISSGQQIAVPIERSPNDTRAITFSFAGPSLTLTGTRSINDGTFTAVSGVISYLRSEGGVDLYTLSYNAADRPTAEGVVRYRFVRSGWVSGDLERFVTLRVASNTVGTNLDKTGYGLAAGAVTSTTVADGAITVAKIADNAITAAKIATNAITAAKIATDAITAAKIATGAFTSTKFAAGAFDAVWTVTTRTLTTVGDSAGVTTLLSRVTALLQTKAQADTDQATLVTEINQNETKIDGIKAKTDQLLFTGTNVNANSQVVADKTGYALTAGERTAIATAVEQAILNDGDGQAVLNAIVGAIGNQNIDQIALVAAIRADIERNGGMLDIVPTLAEIEASTVLAKQSGFTGLATSANVTAAQTALTTEINQNETKIDGIKAKTDVLTFTGSNVHANAQVVSDKANYNLADNAITAAKIATGAFTDTKFATGAFNAVWTVATRTLTAVGDSAGVTTLLSRVTALVETKTEADTRQTALVSEINQNEVKIDGVKAKTDILTFTGSNVHANAQVVSDKTGYGLTAGERTSTAAAVRTNLTPELDKINANLDAPVSQATGVDGEIINNQRLIAAALQNATGTQY